MRTTVTLDDHVLSEAKRRAAERGQTLGELIEEQLRDAFARSGTPAERVEIPVFHGRGGLRPGVDISSNASLLEAMEDGSMR